MIAMAQQWFENQSVLPEGVYVHGRSGQNDLHTGHVIQCTQDWTTAENYGGAGIWIITANESTNVLDLTNSETHERILATLKEHYADGQLPSDLESTCRFIEDWDNVNFNPYDIVDGAEWFDEPFFAQWLYETFNCDMVLLQDQNARYESEGRGAVIINIDNVDAVCVKEV